MESYRASEWSVGWAERPGLLGSLEEGVHERLVRDLSMLLKPLEASISAQSHTCTHTHTQLQISL